jgi:anti-sigma regulatory factor (Ser/Thr protein kinase)
MPFPVFADDGRPVAHGTDQKAPDGSPLRARWIVDVEIDTTSPRLELRAGADKDGLPLARQALRALGTSVGADFDALHDAELALTEACANAVRHAYPDGEGLISVSIAAQGPEIHAVVRDKGRGMPSRPLAPKPIGGLGLKVIEAIALDVEIRSQKGIGTEIAMDLPLYASPHEAPREPIDDRLIERVIRQLVAIVAAQSDLPPDRISEALIAAEIIARNAPAKVVDEVVRLRIERDALGVQLFLGPFVPGGAQAILKGSGMPVLGSIVERFADSVWSVPPETGRASDGEELALRFAT